MDMPKIEVILDMRKQLERDLVALQLQVRNARESAKMWSDCALKVYRLQLEYHELFLKLQHAEREVKKVYEAYEQEQNKFKLTENLKERLAQGARIGDVTTGECDFDHEPATQGRKVLQDVFYLCQRCIVKINS